ncbi:MAE_28990/MAE_18760 family HEPN-like nuclease [Neisseria sp. Ec49-e6-T10]|uniref:MAE_28990/MAE_18760 family HEPN-like nuclease n=1 Tax=Neisseria sp. Ec49-e6-T10 TaxID=3140744 RepID=UPI003EBB1B95
MNNYRQPIDILQEKLDKDLSWRKKEISNLLLHIDSQEGSLQIALIRGAITILYAHWEGFVKVASIKYLEYVCNQGYSLAELTHNFSYITLGKKFPHNQVSMNSYRCQKEIFDYIHTQHQNEKLQISPKDTIKTHSNLTFKHFKIIGQQLGIDISWYSTKENFIDKCLLALRNPIAHGEFRNDGQLLKEFNQMKQHTLDCIEKFKDLIINASENQEFLRETPPLDEMK